MRGQGARQNQQRGFSLLEAIVAMTIFAAGALSLYAWQAQSLKAIQRVSERQAFVAAVQAALPLVEDLNPMVEPRGERRVEDLEVRWTSAPIEPEKPGRTAVGSESIFQLGLYSVDVTVLRDGTEQARFNLRRTGYKQVRQVLDP